MSVRCEGQVRNLRRCKSLMPAADRDGVVRCNSHRDLTLFSAGFLREHDAIARELGYDPDELTPAEEVVVNIEHIARGALS